ncbi:MAG: glycogen synthase GlgA [Clostridia bacterium]|nr:glycogen synthase GlgA [Clostridia bacterium]
MKVLFVTAEAEPFAKTGGLADVAFALPKALLKKGVDVRVIMPKYGDIDADFTNKMSRLSSFGVSVGWRNQYCGLEYLKYDGIPFYFIDNEYYFKRPGCYGYFDDGERFAFFDRAVMESVKHMDSFEPDIIHCNDWHTGIIPVYLRDVYYNSPEFANAHVVFTIHNLKYQGIYSPAVLEELLGLNMGYFTDEKLKYMDCVSFMKAGIVFADRITTVSESYAEEIKGDLAGEGLDGLLREKSFKLCGIVNGIDFERYDPKTDPNLAANYDKKTRVSGKAANKALLQRTMGLPLEPEKPIIAVVSRLARQKGIDLITCVMEQILETDSQFVLLGSGDTDYQDFFEYYASAYPGKVGVKIGFDDRLASLIYAGADILLMPSQFEPCGISQMIAMRYGTVPLVRETGGLKDTVVPYNKFTGEGNGFSFTNYNAHEMLDIIRNAVEVYKDRPAFDGIVKAAMSTDNTWDTGAEKYVALYNDICEK